MKFNQKSQYKIGAYVRVSTEEQAENPEGSIKNQEMRLRDYVKMKNQDQVFGDITEVFTDAGISAKDMKRPSLQRLLAKIKTGEINLLLVTELSRLTRSTKDFSLLWEFMNEHGCKFLSLRDNFDSTTPAGEMIMFTLANFAQFERKQTAERISNSFAARSKRGLWNGGVLPLGFEIDHSRNGHLKIVPEEAEIVRDVFTNFLKEETLARTARSLNDRGIILPRKMRNGGTVRSKVFKIDNTHKILKNKAYIGIKVYQTKDGEKEAKAVWDGIIDPVQFDRVQKLLEKNHMRKKPPSTTRYPYTLSGFLFCKTCGDRLCGKSAHGKGGKIAYYEHAWSTKAQSCLSKKTFSCEPNRILAKKIEPIVWSDIRRMLLSPDYARIIFEEAKAKYSGGDIQAKEIEKLKGKIANLQSQIEATTERVTELPKGIDAKSFYDQILKLQEYKRAFENQLETLAANQQSQEAPINYEDFKKFTEGLKTLTEKCTDPNDQAAIARKLIEKIEVTPDGILIHYHVGETHYLRELSADRLNGAVPLANAPSAAKSGLNQGPETKKGLVDLTRPITKPLLKYRTENSFVECSNTLTFGRG